jgi:hypothetical protein
MWEMQDENYINIFCKFVGKLVQDGKLTVKEGFAVLRIFEPECEKITSRHDLINFIDTKLGYYWELKALRQQLADPNHKFI